MADCPCSSSKPYELCCRPFHVGEAWPQTAEALMRARYSAFAKTRVAFLVDSVHPDHREGVEAEEIRNWAQRSEWLGLDVLRTEAGGPEDSEGIVEFIAEYRDGGITRRHHEIGSFSRLDDRWYFVDGETVKPKPVMREAPKIGRNEPCLCGSGKKYKKCCARKA